MARRGLVERLKSGDREGAEERARQTIVALLTDRGVNSKTAGKLSLEQLYSLVSMKVKAG